MRDRQGLNNQSIEMRCGSIALGRAGAALDWGGAKSNCVGGTVIVLPFVVSGSSVVVLDSSLDWRDRVVWVNGQFRSGTHYIPGDTNAGQGEHLICQADWNVAANPYYLFCGPFYTAKGWDGAAARGGVPRYSYNQPNSLVDLTQTGSQHYLYADATTGYLSFKNTNASAHSGVLFLTASEQTGKASSVP